MRLAVALAGLAALAPAARAQGPGLEAQLLREDPAALARAARAR